MGFDLIAHTSMGPEWIKYIKYLFSLIAMIGE